MNADMFNYSSENSSDVFSLDNVTESGDPTESRSENKVLKTISDIVLPTILCVIMLGMGCTIEFKRLIAHLRPPVGPAIGMMSQFLVLPLSMFGLAHLLQLDPYAAVGMIVLASSPGGSTSNLFSYWADGDVPLSLTMMTLSTILALGLMPLNIWVYSRSWVSDELTVPFLRILRNSGLGHKPFHVTPYINILYPLLMTVIPASIGILMRWKFPKVADRLVKVGSISGDIAIAATIIIVSLRFPFMYNSPWNIYLGAILEPLVGFVFRYVLAKIFRLDDSLARTIALETGIQNYPLCLTVITLSFSSHVISKLALLPNLSGGSMIANSSVFLALHKVVDWIVRTKRTEYREANTDEQETGNSDLITTA